MDTTEGSLPSDRPERADGPDPAGSAKQMASAAGAAVKQEVASFASAAQDKVQGQVEEQRKTAARAIGDFATAIQHAGDELADKDQTMAGHLIKGAADRLSDLARTVSDKRPDELLQGLRDFGRSNPAVFAACSVLAGLAVGRLLRSSVEPLDATADMGAGSASAPVSGQLPVAQYQGSSSPSTGGQSYEGSTGSAMGGQGYGSSAGSSIGTPGYQGATAGSSIGGDGLTFSEQPSSSELSGSQATPDGSADNELG